MTQTGRKQILLCVTGKTPQIVTETLYVLTQQRQERIDEIRVITTLEGRDAVMKHLVEPDKGQLGRFCRDYKINPATIVFDESSISLLRAADGRMLEDIRTVEDNEDAANQICQIVRELTEDDGAALHASVAGGRKTMGVYLTAAMQLFGRPQDQLSHVLVSEDFETHPEFYYIPPVPQDLDIQDRKTGQATWMSTAQAQIHLASIPFIRLRRILGDRLAEDGWRYSDEVKRAQEELEFLEAAHIVRLNCENQNVSVGGRRVGLTPRMFFTYALFARFQQTGCGQGGFVSPADITLNDLDLLYRVITRARGEELRLDQARQDEAGYQFVESMASFLRTGAVDAFQDCLVEDISRIKRRFRDHQIPAHFGLSTRGRYGHKLYGIAVPRERIEWEQTKHGATRRKPETLARDSS
ncbi:MAG: CRISPR-associated ring nuclease Csm6 [Verrucomicrobiales bacterium]|nr:CRISPR-associated ring nuclease Csm6 [Verrucomicrobiales bacterium]